MEEKNMKNTEQAGLPDMEALRGMVQQMLDEVRAGMQAADQQRLMLEAMTDEQKSDYALAQREKAVQEREQKLLSRELRARAVEALAEKGLPGQLADALPYASEAECMRALDSLELAFREAVRQAVDNRLRGQAPASGQARPMDADRMSDADYYSALNRGVPAGRI